MSISISQNFKILHSHLPYNCTRHLSHLLCLHHSRFCNLLWCMRQCREIHFECRNMIQDHIFWTNTVHEFQNFFAGLTVFYLIKIDSTHGQEEKESQALQSGNFSKQMIDKSHLKHVTLGCRDMEEYLFHLTSIVCWNKFYI